MTKEQIYDKQISPMMKKIIDICKQNKIGLVAQFCVLDEEDNPIRVNTCLVGEGYPQDALHDNMVQTLSAQYMAKPTMKITTTKPDGSQDIEVIL